MNSARMWPIAVVAMLAVTVAANVVLLVQAGDREAATIEPDYYRKAVEWDSTLAQRARNAALGWTLEAALGASGAEDASLTVRVADRAGAPIAGARVAVEAFHNRVPLPVRGVLRPVSPGRYAGTLPLRRPGLWELRFEVVRAGERFTATARREAAAGRAAPARTHGSARSAGPGEAAPARRRS